MIFPQQKILKELVKLVNELKNTENSRSTEDSKILSQILNKQINVKEAILQLKKKNLLSDSKKIDEKASDLVVRYNNIFSDLSLSLNIARIPKYKLHTKTIIDKIFSKKQETKIELPKPQGTTVIKTVTVPKVEITTGSKQDEELITKPQVHVNPEIPIVEKTIELIKKKKLSFNFDFIKNLFKTHKKEEKQKEGITRPFGTTPTFEPPKELLPENYQILIPGFAYAFIKEDNDTRTYVIAEPELTKDEEKILLQTKTELINKISLADLANESQMYNLIDRIFEKNKIKLDKKQKEKIVYYIIRQVSGLDKIEPLMHDSLIEDIECNGIGIPIFIVHRKYGHIITNIAFDSENELQQFVIKMAHLSKSYVSYASPLLDSILPDGSRVNATLTSNVSTRGPTFTIRKFPQKPLTTIDIVNSNTVTPIIVAYLWTLIEFKKNMVLIGPTAGGKTTLLNVISSFIPPAERVVSIEDTREINLLLENWIPQVSRPGFGPPDSSGKKYGEVTMGDLLKESFRQRPDYLIIGEVRGVEMALMFQGMASGHCSLSTVHAKSVESLVIRLTTPPISLDPSLLTSLDIVIVTGFSGSGENHREVKEIDEIRGYNVTDHKIEFNAIYKSTDRFEKKGATTQSDLFTNELPLVYNSDVLKDISKEHNIQLNKLSELIAKRTNFINGLTKDPPKDYVEFNKKLRAYKITEKLIFD